MNLSVWQQNFKLGHIPVVCGVSDRNVPEQPFTLRRCAHTVSGYIERYIDKNLIKMIADWSNASSLPRSVDPLNTSTDEIYLLFFMPVFWCLVYHILQSGCTGPKPKGFFAITEKFTRDIFFKLRQSFKVLIDDGVPKDLRERDKFWKVMPFLNRILKGCRSQAQPECVCIVEQMIPFKGACRCRQYLPIKPNPVGMINCLCNVRWDCARLWNFSRCRCTPWARWRTKWSGLGRVGSRSSVSDSAS